MATPLATPAALDVLGADLHPGHVLLRLDGPHTIDRLRDYPGLYVSGGARVAYYNGGECTVADGQMFHVQYDDKGNRP